MFEQMKARKDKGSDEDEEKFEEFTRTLISSHEYILTQTYNHIKHTANKYMQARAI